MMYANSYIRDLVEKNLEFKDFMLLCSDCYAQPLKVARTYKNERLDDAIAELAKLSSLSEEEQIEYGKQDIDRATIAHLEAMQQDLIYTNRLNAMIKQVMAWQPPEKHEEYKKTILI